MNKILFFIACILLFSCQNSQELNSTQLTKFKAVESFAVTNYEDLTSLYKETLDSNWVTEFFSENEISSKNGSYFEGMNFTLYPLCKITNKQNQTYYVLSKEIELVDGKLAEVHAIKLNDRNKITSSQKIGYFESIAECTTNSIINYHNYSL
ncbi:MAG: hypothetical protein OEW87_12355, partial [Flavobacteriaceae bacterium]|nr:hypothetical protein [Flavobacteriaceae bacterium]